MLKRYGPVLSLFMATSLVACKTTGTDMAAATVNDVKKLRTELADGQEDIRATVAALNELVAEGGDMNAEYKAFTKSVDGVESQRDRVRSSREKLASKKEAFVASWNERLAAIQSTEMRDRASERRDAVAEEFEKVQTSADDLRKEFDAWFTSVTDVQAYLEFDLNPEGVASVSDDAESIAKNADKINESLDEFVGKLDKLAATLEAAKPPEATQSEAPATTKS